jgi:integrase
MGKKVRGWITEKDGKFYARMDYTDENGKHVQVKRTAYTKKEAKRILKKLISKKNQRLFKELVELYKKERAKPPVIIDGFKADGMKGYKRTLSLIKPIELYFGDCTLKSVTYEMLAAYKQHRFDTPVVSKNKKPKKRGHTGINRELEVIRAMLFMAVQKRWLKRNPYKDGKPLINKSAEKQRERIITPEEEEKLLFYCTKREKREHLYWFIILAVDSGMRPGEIAKMTVSDLDFEKKVIAVKSTNSKTEKFRLVPMSSRVKMNFEMLTATKKPNDLVFTVKNPKKSFRTVRKLAGLGDDVTLYTLRHTFASRILQEDLKLPLLSRILGHSSITMTYRYLNLNLESAQKAANLIDAYLERRETDKKPD